MWPNSCSIQLSRCSASSTDGCVQDMLETDYKKRVTLPEVRRRLRLYLHRQSVWSSFSVATDLNKMLDTMLCCSWKKWVALRLGSPADGGFLVKSCEHPQTFQSWWMTGTQAPQVLHRLVVDLGQWESPKYTLHQTPCLPTLGCSCDQYSLWKFLN